MPVLIFGDCRPIPRIGSFQTSSYDLSDFIPVTLSLRKEGWKCWQSAHLPDFPFGYNAIECTFVLKKICEANLVIKSYNKRKHSFFVKDGIMKSYFSLFTNYANYSGFMKRGDYWTAMIIHWIILLVPLYPLDGEKVVGYFIPQSFRRSWPSFRRDQKSN